MKSGCGDLGRNTWTRRGLQRKPTRSASGASTKPAEKIGSVPRTMVMEDSGAIEQRGSEPFHYVLLPSITLSSLPKRSLCSSISVSRKRSISTRISIKWKPYTQTGLAMPWKFAVLRTNISFRLCYKGNKARHNLCYLISLSPVVSPCIVPAQL